MLQSWPRGQVRELSMYCHNSHHARCAEIWLHRTGSFKQPWGQRRPAIWWYGKTSCGPAYMSAAASVVIHRQPTEGYAMADHLSADFNTWLHSGRLEADYRSEPFVSVGRGPKFPCRHSPSAAPRTQKGTWTVADLHSPIMLCISSMGGQNLAHL